jgi:hypothetical protein
MSQFFINSSGSGPGGDITLVPDTGPSLVGTTFNVFGQTAFSAQVVETHTTGGDFFIEDRTWFTPYVVDDNATVGQRGTYSTIQAAIDAAFTDGSASEGRAYIRIRGGIYVENLVFQDETGYYLEGESPQPFILSTVIGNHTLGTTTLSVNNLNFQSAVGPSPFTLGAGRTLYSNNSNLGTTTVSSGELFMDSSGGAVLISSGTARLFNCNDVELNMSGGTVIYTQCTVDSITLSGSSAPILYDCTAVAGSAQNITGTTSGTPRFYGSINNGTINWTGNVTVGALTLDSTVSSEMFGTTVVPLLSPTVQGNVLIAKRVAIDTTVSRLDYYIGVTSTAAARNITLPATASSATRAKKNQTFIINDESGGAAANNITITPNGGTIDGAGSVAISTNYGQVKLIFDGTNYFTI